MRNFSLIFKLQLKNMLRRDKTKNLKKSIPIFILLAIAYVIVAAALISLVVLMGKVFATFSLQSEFLTLIMLCGLLFVLIFGIVTVLTGLYFSRDTEFFLGLPVKPSTVFAAKIAVVYVCELVMTALILLPCMIAAGVVMHLGVAFYVLTVLGVLFTPAIPLFLASVIAIPIMYIVSFMKNRGALGSLLVLVLFGAFFALYYWGITKMQDIAPDEMDLDGVRHIFVNLANTAYPLYALARAMTLTPVFGLNAAASAAVDLLIWAGSIVAVGGIALLISATVYKRGAARQLESSGKRKSAVAAQYRSTGVVKALMKKEWREILRTPGFALNCLFGIVLCPIVTAFVGFSTSVSKIANQAAAEGAPISPYALALLTATIRLIMLWIVSFMSAGTDGAAPTAFSREGERAYYCKLLPVDVKTQIRAKSYLYMLIGSVSGILGTVVMAILDFDLSFFLCSLVFVLLLNFAVVHFGMYLDLSRPKLKWVTTNEVMKHNRNVAIVIFTSMFFTLVAAEAGLGVFYLVYRAASHTAAIASMWTVILALALAAATASYAALYKNCDRLMNAIEM